MEYKTIKSDYRPYETTDQFTVFEVGEEKHIYCPIRSRSYKVDEKPEEIVRQYWIYRLVEVYGYELDQIAVEVPVVVGSTEAKKKADIVVYADASKKKVRLFIEVKKPNRKDGLEQLKTYMNATGTRLGLWSNGGPNNVYLLRIEPTGDEEEARWRELRNIPRKNETISDVDTPLLRRELEPIHDFLSVLKECEDYIKAHEGTTPFEEIFKLIFAKLYDERTNLKNDDSPAVFRVGVQEVAEEAKARITQLFTKAKERWSGVFQAGEQIQLAPESLAFCVSALQKLYLLKSDSDVLGSAFEVMINPGMKGDKGQYFTPRHVIKMAIEVLDPRDGETVFDPACGSGGFLVAAMDHVYQQIERDRDDQNEIIENKKDYASENVYGMDYDPLIAKVAKAYMLIWGDGRSNIAVCDGLNHDNWEPEVLSKFATKSGKKIQLRQFQIIATNPPFAGDISTEDTLSKYELAYKVQRNNSRKRVNKLSRHKLFVERCINMLEPLGRMAIVLPRGVLKNYSDESVRRYILDNCRVVAVVGLGGDVFKPFTNTKTVVLFVQKRRERIEVTEGFEGDGDIQFCVAEKSGKDKSGSLVFNSLGEIVSDLPEISTFLKKKIRWEQ